jgi:GDP-fucose transporter C1
MKETNYIATVVATYWFVSISMVYLNKVLMSSEEVSIPAPLFVTWFQCVVTAWICWIAGEVAARMKTREYDALAKSDDETESNPKPSFWAQFPRAEYHVGKGRKVFPLSLIFVGMITFNNLCLKWVEVSFYNVARSLTIVFNVIFTQALLGTKTSFGVMMCLLIVILGFLMGSRGETNFSMWGTVSGVLSSLFVSLNSIYTKKVLPVVENDHWKLTYYNNINACILFLPLIIVFEHDALVAGLTKQFLSPIFWSAMGVAGFFGFSIGKLMMTAKVYAAFSCALCDGYRWNGVICGAYDAVVAYRVPVSSLLYVLSSPLAYSINRNRDSLANQSNQSLDAQY